MVERGRYLLEMENRPIGLNIAGPELELITALG
jgi:hypothetical protein